MKIKCNIGYNVINTYVAFNYLMYSQKQEQALYNYLS